MTFDQYNAKLLSKLNDMLGQLTSTCQFGPVTVNRHLTQDKN